MKRGGRSREINTAELIVIEVMRITKLSNPRFALGVTEEDLDYVIQNIATQYLMEDFDAGKKILDEAITQFFALSQRESNVGIGDFTRIAFALKTQRDEQLRTQNLITKPTRSKSAVAEEHLKIIRETLARAIRPLPYDKNFRVGPSGQKE